MSSLRFEYMNKVKKNYVLYTYINNYIYVSQRFFLHYITRPFYRPRTVQLIATEKLSQVYKLKNQTFEEQCRRQIKILKLYYGKHLQIPIDDVRLYYPYGICVVITYVQYVHVYNQCSWILLYA